MTVFVVALATIIVLNLQFETRYDARASRAFSEGIQAEYILKSGLNLGRVLLELPKLDGIKEDWLGEPWALIGSAPSLPISGVVGETRLEIVDEEGKIDINAIISSSSATLGISNPFPTQASAASANTESADYWKNVLRELFYRQGFQRVDYRADEQRTPLNTAFGPSDQVAVLHDWIDADGDSYSSALFDGEGIESGATKGFFYNRAFSSLSELALAPGMTLERLARVAPYVRTSSSPAGVRRQVNVNTAPLEVLMAMGFPESMALEMHQQRLDLPITKDILNTLVEGDPQLKKFTKTTSREFSIFARVVMPNSTHWLRAFVTVSGITRRRARLKSIELH